MAHRTLGVACTSLESMVALNDSVRLAVGETRHVAVLDNDYSPGDLRLLSVEGADRTIETALSGTAVVFHGSPRPERRRRRRR